jgi:predicted enzyme related to lactoylglutathione lyase
MSMAARKSTKQSSKKAAKRAAPKSAKKAAAPAARKVQPGFISHTELASRDPPATRQWAEKTLGWKFGAPMPTPNGPYHMWSHATRTGGGIRANNAPEMPGTIPYVEVASMKAAYDKALKNGATPMMPPDQVPGGMGWIAIVQAPGGVPIGFWAQK